MKNTSKYKNFTVTLSDQERENLYMIVEREGGTVCSFVRSAVDERLKKFGYTIEGKSKMEKPKTQASILLSRVSRNFKRAFKNSQNEYNIKSKQKSPV